MNQAAWIRLYGGPEVVVEGQSSAFTPIQACLVALAYVEPHGTLSRKRVSWLLWGQGEDARSRQRIRQLLYNINSICSRRILEREGEAILPLLASDAADVDPSDAQPLARIMSPPTTDFEQWMDRAAASLVLRRGTHLARELDRAVEGGDLPVVEAVARRMIGLKQGGPGAVLDLAWSLHCRGHSRSAAAELDAAIALPYLRASQGALRTARLAVQKARPLPGHRPSQGLGEARPLGRDVLLREVWRQLVDTNGGSVVLFGPPAIGRTLLLAELARSIAVRFPGGVLTAMARGGQDQRAFGLCEEWLRNEAMLSFLKAERSLGPFLQRAFSQLAEDVGMEALASAERPIEQDRIALDFARLLVKFGDGHPPILISDDLHAADTPSLELLGDLLSHTSSKVRLLGSARAQSRHQAESLVSRIFPNRPPMTLVEVPELDRESAVRLVQQVGADMSRSSARRIVNGLGGIPGYLVEAAARGDQASGPLPRDARELVEARISRLPPSARLLCSSLAVAGIESSVETLSEVSRTPLPEILLAVEHLVAEGLLVRGTEGVWFRQNFLATGCYARLSEGERTGLHSRFLRAVSEGNPISSASLERHVVAAGAPTTVILPQLRSEAEIAERRGALSEAARLWQVASGAATGEERIDLALRNIDLLIRLRRFDSAETAIRRCSDASPPHERQLKLRSFRIRSLTAPGEVSATDAQELLEALQRDGEEIAFASALDTALAVADFQSNEDWVARLLASADGASASSSEARTWLNLARTRHLYLGKAEWGLASARQAVQEAGRCASTGTLSRALNRLIVALIFRGLLATPEGAQTLRRARALAKRDGDSLLLYDTFVNEGSWLMDVGHLDAAAEAFAAATEVLGEDSSQLESLTMRVNRGELWLHQGRAEEAYEEFTQALVLAGPHGAGRHLCAAGLALSNLELGRIRAAKEWAKELSEIDPTARFRGNLALVALAQARIAAAQRNSSGAVETLLSFGRGMLPWMIPASLKLYLEAFRLSLRAKVALSQREVLHVVSVAETLGIPGHGKQICLLRPRLLQQSET